MNTNSSLALANSATNGLRDIKPPLEIPNPWLYVWWGLGLALLGTLLGFALVHWLSKRKEAPLQPLVPAHVRAKQRLREALALLSKPREFCITVSDAVRCYLEERFNFHAPERTTEEFLYELQSTNLLTPDQKQSLGEFLKRCDLVKFARYEPREPELHDLHDAALRLVEETEPAPLALDTALIDAPPAGGKL